MRALVFRPSRWRRLLAHGTGAFTHAFHWGRPSGLSLEEVEEPPLPGPGWVRLQVSKAGISRDDLRALTYRDADLLEPFRSGPAVPGGEILGRVVEAGPEVGLVGEGARVVVDPWLSCAARGFPDEPCPACARGLPALCARAGEEGAVLVAGRPLRRGARLGLHADLPGGWAERVLAHESQLVPVDDALTDRAAALVEPLAAALHAVLAAGVGGGEAAASGGGGALVLGGGARGLATVRALRVLGFRGELLVRVDREAEADPARALGATAVAEDDGALRDAMAATGARAYMPVDGEEVWAGGGFSPVFDWRGDPDTAVRHLAPGGRLVLPGAVGGDPGKDGGGALSLARAGGATLVGAVGHGPRMGLGAGVSTFRLAHDLLLGAGGGGGALGSLVTHVYPLGQHREALDAAAGKGRESPLKVLLDPGA